MSSGSIDSDTLGRASRLGIPLVSNENSLRRLHTFVILVNSPRDRNAVPRIENLYFVGTRYD